MNEKIKGIIFTLVIVIVLICIASCSNNSGTGPETSGTDESNLSTEAAACEHVYDKTEIITEASCQKEGLQRQTCSKCGKTSVTAIPVTEHAIIALGEEKKVTCTENGITAGSKCAVCNTVFEPQNMVVAVGHIYDNEKDESCNACGFERDLSCKHLSSTPILAVAPTCTSTGLTQGSKCIACEAILVAQTVVDKASHTEAVLEAVNATCTAAGLSAGKKCTVCNEVLVAQTPIEATGHTEVVDLAVAATCQKDGLTAGSHCSVCSTVIKKAEAVPKGHYSEGKCEACKQYILMGTYTFYRAEYDTPISRTDVGFTYSNKKENDSTASFFEYRDNCLYFGLNKVCDNGKWSVAEQYITFDKEYAVSEEIYLFFSENTTVGKYELRGKWYLVFNEFQPQKAMDISQDIKFTYWDRGSSSATNAEPQSADGTAITLHYNPDSSQGGVKFNHSKDAHLMLNWALTNPLTIESYIDFGTAPQATSKDFYCAFTAFAYDFEDNAILDVGAYCLKRDYTVDYYNDPVYIGYYILQTTTTEYRNTYTNIAIYDNDVVVGHPDRLLTHSDIIIFTKPIFAEYEWERRVIEEFSKLIEPTEAREGLTVVQPEK